MHPKTELYIAVVKAALWLERRGVNPWLKGWAQAQKAALWKAGDRIAQRHEPAYRRAAIAAFEADKRAILAALKDAERKALTRKATIDWDAFIIDVSKYLESAGVDNWRSKFVPVIRGTVIDQGKRWQAATGLRFDVQNLEARNWFNNYALRFAQQPTQTTRDTIAKLAAQAQEHGLSIGQMQKQLNAMFDVWQTNSPPDDPDFEWIEERRPAYRTEMIARTETVRASNAGSTAIFRDWGVQQKEWISTKDDRTRGPNSPESPSEFDHIGADGEIVPIDGKFIRTGEALEFPGDPAGSPGNTISCRCSVLPVIEGE